MAHAACLLLGPLRPAQTPPTPARALQFGFALLGLTQSESRSREVRVLSCWQAAAALSLTCMGLTVPGLQACLAREARTAFKWRSAELQAWAWAPQGPPAPKQIKALAREGIPSALRPLLWFRFSGACTQLC